MNTSLAERYNTIDDVIAIGRHSFSMLRVRDTNALLESLSPLAFANDERLPYWAEVWSSSVEMARHFLEDDTVMGKKVLELGCGLGLAGIAAATAGADVMFTDYEPDALLFAQENARRNLSPRTLHLRTAFRLLDWNSDELFDPVDNIIGADIVYERKNFLPILKFVRRVLKKDGSAVFTDPDRTMGMSFFALAEKEGFRVSITSRDVESVYGARTILLGRLQPGEPHP